MPNKTRQNEGQKTKYGALHDINTISYILVETASEENSFLIFQERENRFYTTATIKNSYAEKSKLTKISTDLLISTSFSLGSLYFEVAK